MSKRGIAQDHITTDRTEVETQASLATLSAFYYAQRRHEVDTFYQGASAFANQGNKEDQGESGLCCCLQIMYRSTAGDGGGGCFPAGTGSGRMVDGVDRQHRTMSAKAKASWTAKVLPEIEK